MKKKLIGMSVIAAAMTVAMSFSAFAGWVQDTNGWSYIRDDGSQVWAGWFTDPADGAMYYIDPDGYMMTETRVEGYWLGADGRRLDKTQEDIDREKARAERENNKPTPNKTQQEAKVAAQAAKSATAAATTARKSYQAELQVFMDKYFLETAKVLTPEDIHIQSDVSKTNINTEYSFRVKDQADIISASLWQVSNKTSENYKAEAAQISYNRGILAESINTEHFDKLFRDMSIAALGDTTGSSVYNGIFEQLSNGVYSFESNGTTDAGNYYTLSCGNGIITIDITCSELAAAEAAAEAAASAAEQPAEEAIETKPATSSVIVVGGSTDSDSDDATDTSQEDYSPEDESADNETAE